MKTLFAFIESVMKDPKAPLVTHRRFIGNDDYKSFILVQEPCKDRQPDSEDEDIIKLNQEPEEILICKACDFSTTRLGVLLIHNQLHLEGKSWQLIIAYYIMIYLLEIMLNVLNKFQFFFPL